MIGLLSNTVDIDKVQDEVTYSEAIDFINTLSDEELSKLDTIDLPAGRAAYRQKLCKCLPNVCCKPTTICMKRANMYLTWLDIGVLRQIPSVCLWAILQSIGC